VRARLNTADELIRADAFRRHCLRELPRDDASE
jgi:hypothetical protein